MEGASFAKGGTDMSVSSASPHERSPADEAQNERHGERDEKDFGNEDPETSEDQDEQDEQKQQCHVISSYWTRVVRSTGRSTISVRVVSPRANGAKLARNIR